MSTLWLDVSAGAALMVVGFLLAMALFASPKKGGAMRVALIRWRADPGELWPAVLIECRRRGPIGWLLARFARKPDVRVMVTKEQASMEVAGVHAQMPAML
ncbi:MAG TPA: hypothetical protein VEU08_09675, partial [Vicinamibacterales bacterium]|nr:hypothetical protein [Vicinamibacterales bacterium]